MLRLLFPLYFNTFFKRKSLTQELEYPYFKEAPSITQATILYKLFIPSFNTTIIAAETLTNVSVSTLLKTCKIIFTRHAKSPGPHQFALFPSASVYGLRPPQDNIATTGVFPSFSARFHPSVYPITAHAPARPGR